MPSSGQLPRPQEFYIRGLALEIFSVHPQENRQIVKNGAEHDYQRELLFTNCQLEFFIGDKRYVDIPVTRILQSSVASDHNTKVTMRFGLGFLVLGEEPTILEAVRPTYGPNYRRFPHPRRPGTLSVIV